MKFSILIPVYNAEKYIRRCLDSIVVQTFKDFEVVIINDGSVDGTSEVLTEYAANYPYIRVIHQTNHGVAYTRNRLLSEAHGDFLLFVDSDDYVSKKYLFKFKEQIDCSSNDGFSVDVLVCHYCEIYNGREREKRFYEISKPQDFCAELLKKEYRKVPSVLWAKCFRKSFLLDNGIHFSDNFNMGEDLFFLVQVFYKAAQVVFLKETLYFWERSNEQSMTRSNKYDNDNILCYQEIINFLSVKEDFSTYAPWINIGKMKLRMQHYLNVKQTRKEENSFVFNDVTYWGLSFIDKIRLFCINNDFLVCLKCVNKVNRIFKSI